MHQPRTGPRSRGWFWSVVLQREGEAAPPMIAGLVLSSGPGTPHFVVHKQTAHPGTGMPVPAAVEVFGRALRDLTELPVARPQVLPATRVRGPGLRVGSHSRLISTATKSSVTRYDSLDDVPAHLREGVEEHRITIRSSDGTVNTYNSLDEMPLEVRRRYEAILKDRPRRR